MKMTDGLLQQSSAACYYETSVSFNETTQRYIPEGYHIHTHHHENLEYYEECYIHPYNTHLRTLLYLCTISVSTCFDVFLTHVITK
jgi:hypothetical protein